MNSSTYWVISEFDSPDMIGISYNEEIFMKGDLKKESETGGRSRVL
jgi:hypothetical protein